MPRGLAELNAKAVGNETFLDLPHENDSKSFSASLEGVQRKLFQAIPVVHRSTIRNLRRERALYCFDADDVPLEVRGPKWRAVLKVRTDVRLIEEQHRVHISSSEGSEYPASHVF